MMRLLALLAALLAGACCASLPRASAKRVAFPALEPEHEGVIETAGYFIDERRGDRKIPLRTYTPTGSHGKLPVVIVSHGIGEDRDSYAYLGRALARHGFLVVHVTHPGTDREVLERGYRELYRATKQKENWINRPRDVSFVLDRLGDNADVERTAIVGHSAGAFTAFALAGMRAAEGGQSLRDPRVKAIVPISMPRLGDVIPPDGYDAIDIPVLNVTGTCDTSWVYRTFPKHRRIPFESSRAPLNYLVTFDRVNHDTFSLPNDRHHDAIAAVTAAFLRAWIKNDAAARAWFDESGQGEAHGVRVSVERKTGSAR